MITHAKLWTCYINSTLHLQVIDTRSINTYEQNIALLLLQQYCKIQGMKLLCVVQLYARHCVILWSQETDHRVQQAYFVCVKI